MNAHPSLARVLLLVGALAMLVGSADPLEGSVLIVPGSGIIALGAFLGKYRRGILLYWTWVFLLILVGVAAMFVLSAFGGIGGKHGHSAWWGVVLVPYPVGLLMSLLGAAVLLVRSIQKKLRQRKPDAQTAHS